MRNYKQILEAIDRGINIALDDYDDEEISIQKNSKLTDKNSVLKNIFALENFVDLGLPSGTLWNKYNLGVDPERLDHPKYWFGNYYQWGETTPVFNFLDDINAVQIDPKKFVNSRKLKYNELDKLTELLPEDDPVYQHYKSTIFHMPTPELFDELRKYTKYRCIPDYNHIEGLNGVKLIGPNENEIFFPENGFIDNTSGRFSYLNSAPYIWTNKMQIYDGLYNYGPLHFGFHTWFSIDWMVREFATGVRPVVNLK